MSKFQTAYDTSACSATIIKKTQDGLTRAFIQGLLKVDQETGLVLVQGGALVDELVPSFAHPMLFNHGHDQHVAVDVRAAGKYSADQGEFSVRNKPEYDAIRLRGILTEVWVSGSVETVRNLSALPLMLYANWVGEAIAKRMALDPGAQYATTILAAVLYLNLFETQVADEGEHRSYLVSTIARTLGYKSEVVYDVVEAHSTISNVAEFCEACKEYTQSVRMRDLNQATLYAMVGGFWYGNNGREIIAVALEHPPTWLTLIFQAYNDRTFKNAGLTKITERGTFKRHAPTFQTQLLHLAKNLA